MRSGMLRRPLDAEPCWRSPGGAAGSGSSATRRSSIRCGGCWSPAPTRHRSAWSGAWRRGGTWCGSSPTCCGSRTPSDAIPASCSQPIERPIFITGLPRSGTTFLHRLLLEDPDNRAPLVWQTIYPYPLPKPGRGGRMRARRAWRGSCGPSSGWRRSSADCIRSMPPRRRSAARSPRTSSAACASTRRIAFRPTGAGWIGAAICRPTGSTSASCSTCSIRTAAGDGW